MKEKILLLGTGFMAIEYAKILKSLAIPFITVGRGETSAQNYTEQTGESVHLGGYQQWLDSQTHIPSVAIVAIAETSLCDATTALIKRGVKNILVEKPGGLCKEDMSKVATLAEQEQAQVFIGYNRRFYASVLKAKEMIAEDGGLLSFCFEFTEWEHIILDLKKEEAVKHNWFLANSSHVVDLAFFIGGTPKVLQGYTAGKMDWHPRAAIYAGAGVSNKGALFSYQANWQAPGRWSLDFMTKKRRLIFRPMEKLQVQNLKSVAIESVEIDDTWEKDFKPGLYLQMKAFLGNQDNLLSIGEHVEMLHWYDQINKPS